MKQSLSKSQAYSVNVPKLVSVVVVSPLTNGFAIFSPDYCDYWYKEYALINCKYNTQVAYKAIIDNHIKPELGLYKLKGIQPAVLQQFINKKYSFGYSKNHLFNIYTVLSGSLKAAVFPYQFIKENPMQYVKMPKYEHSKTETNYKVINKEDYGKIIERFPYGSSFYIPLMIAYHTGVRVGECTALTWDCIDLDKKTINITKQLLKKNKDWHFGPTKTASSVREIDFGDTLCNILKQHKKWQAENRLKYGSYYTKYYLYKDNDKSKDNRIYTVDSTIKTTDAVIMN
jgi:integrase